MSGAVVYVAAGWGDPRLLPVGARDALASAAAVVYDARIEPSALAELLEPTTEGCAKVAHAGGGGASSAELLEITTRARAGDTVVRLTRDDVLFSSWGEDELAALRAAGVGYEMVPCAHPALAVAAYAGFPLTRGSDPSPSLAIVRAETEADVGLHDWAGLANATDTLVVIVSRASLDQVVESLLYHGRSGGVPAAVVVRPSLATQRIEVGTLGDVATRARRLGEDGLRLLVVGDPLARRDAVRWFDARPLFGKRVVVTRAGGQARGTSDLLRSRGAEPILAPAIAIHPPADPAPLAAALARVAEAYDWLVLTSANGVERVFAELARQGKDARAIGAARVAAIGPGTEGALRANGVKADLVAREFKGEGLAEALLGDASGTPKRALIARALVARDALPDALRAAGWSVDVVAAYETRAPSGSATGELARRLEAGEIDAVTFTSSSTVTNLCEGLGAGAAALLAKTKVACIGPITRKTAEALGVRVDVEASPYTVRSLVDALEKSFA